MTEDKTDLELIVLEDLFNNEAKCQMKHTTSSCSTEVTHTAVDCEKHILICATGASLIEKMIQLNHDCKHCKKPAAQCWKLVTV